MVRDLLLWPAVRVVASPRIVPSDFIAPVSLDSVVLVLVSVVSLVLVGFVFVAFAVAVVVCE